MAYDGISSPFVKTSLEEKVQDALDTLKRLAELTPDRANAQTPQELHYTVAAIAESAIARLNDRDGSGV